MSGFLRNRVADEARRTVQLRGILIRETRERVPKIIMTEPIAASRSDDAVPKGWRKMRPEEGTLIWQHDLDFRNDLYTNGPVWTAQEKLFTKGLFEIGQNGKLGRPRIISGFIAGQITFHYPGKGTVALCAEFFGATPVLALRASYEPNQAFRVACVLDEAQIAENLRVY